jgi:hypothetical protein
LKEEYTFTVFENKVLRRKFGSERKEVTEDWRKLCNGNKMSIEYYWNSELKEDETEGALYVVLCLLLEQPHHYLQSELLWAVVSNLISVPSGFLGPS